MSVILSAGADHLELNTDAGGECTLTLHAEGEERVLGRDPLRIVRSRLLAGLERALSDVFTVVGSIDGMPVVHLLSFDAATASVYLTMDAETIIVQDDIDRSVLARIAVTEDDLREWVAALQ